MADALTAEEALAAEEALKFLSEIQRRELARILLESAKEEDKRAAGHREEARRLLGNLLPLAATTRKIISTLPG